MVKEKGTCLIIQQKYLYCFTKIYQKVQQIILHSYKRYILDILSMYLSTYLPTFLPIHLSISQRYQKVGLKCSLLPWIWFFWWGQRPQKLYLGNSMILAEPMCINSVPRIPWLPTACWFSFLHLQIRTATALESWIMRTAWNDAYFTFTSYTL